MAPQQFECPSTGLLITRISTVQFPSQFDDASDNAYKHLCSDALHALYYGQLEKAIATITQGISQSRHSNPYVYGSFLILRCLVELEEFRVTPCGVAGDTM